ncbi:hypothetical protein X975_07713, partial [Stegodyphus mimosarum]
MILIYLCVLYGGLILFSEKFVKTETKFDEAVIPYLEDNSFGMNENEDEDDEDLLPPCDLTNPDPKMMEWRLLSNSHEIILDQ